MTAPTSTRRVMDAVTAAQLREPFKPYEVGKLPRVTCYNCRENKREKVCDSHKKSRCDGCNNYITSAHIHLDYVGHAEITDRLLQVDPEWTWEPVAQDAQGLPFFDADGGLWIRLTVAGVTRLGYGDAEKKGGANGRKEAIGDALRNAAMRFGVGLDLWGAKFDDADTSDSPASRRAEAGGAAATETPEEPAERSELATQLAATLTAATKPTELKAAWEPVVQAKDAGKLTAAEYNELVRLTSRLRGRLETAAPAAEPAGPKAADQPLASGEVKMSNVGQRDNIANNWVKLGLDRPAQLARIAELIDRTITDDAELTFVEATKIFDWQTRQSWAGADEVTPEDAGPHSKPAGVTKQQHAAMHILWTAIGYDKDRERRLNATSHLVGRRITTSAELTAEEAETVIRGLKAKQRKDRADARAKAAQDREPVGASA